VAQLRLNLNLPAGNQDLAASAQQTGVFLQFF
jgi:hypothetical protein